MYLQNYQYKEDIIAVFLFLLEYTTSHDRQMVFQIPLLRIDEETYQMEI